MATESLSMSGSKMRECLSRRALLRVGLAWGGSTLFSAAPRYTAARQLDAGQAEPVALKTDFGFKGSALGASHPVSSGRVRQSLEPAAA
jgi:hypothetical protein